MLLQILSPGHPPSTALGGRVGPTHGWPDPGEANSSSEITPKEHTNCGVRITYSDGEPKGGGICSVMGVQPQSYLQTTTGDRCKKQTPEHPASGPSHHFESHPCPWRIQHLLCITDCRSLRRDAALPAPGRAAAAQPWRTILTSCPNLQTASVDAEQKRESL